MFSKHAECSTSLLWIGELRGERCSHCVSLRESVGKEEQVASEASKAVRCLCWKARASLSPSRRCDCCTAQESHFGVG